MHGPLNVKYFALVSLYLQQTFDLPYDCSITPCTSDKMHTPQHNSMTTTQNAVHHIYNIPY